MELLYTHPIYVGLMPALFIIVSTEWAFSRLTGLAGITGGSGTLLILAWVLGVTIEVALLAAGVYYLHGYSA